MKQFLFTLLLFSAYFPLNAQSILDDLTNYKSTVLPNGLTIITVETSTDTLVNFRFIADYNPKINKIYPGAVQIITRYFSYYKNGYDQIYKIMVANTNAIDSTFIFAKDQINTTLFNSVYIEKARNLEIKKYNMLKNSFNEHKEINRRFCFGANSPYAKFFTEDDFLLVNQTTISEVMKEVFIPKNFYIVAVGDISHDTIVKYATKNFGTWQNSSQITSSAYTFTRPDFSTVFFTDNPVSSFFSANYPINIFYTDDDFFTNQVLFQVFATKLSDDLSTFSPYIITDFDPAPIDARLSINGEINNGNIYATTMQVANTMRDMLIYAPTADQINKAKIELSAKITKTYISPYNIANYAYITYKYKLQNNFFKNYIKNINAVSVQDAKNNITNVFFPDNINFFIQANYLSVVCDLYGLGEFIKIEFYDEFFNKYKIIPKGFNADFIINDYLNACKVNSKIKNLTILFNTEYQADTIYTVKGIIYKKYPSYYFYKTQLFVEQDSFLQQLQIANQQAWLDSSALGAEYYTQSDEFWAKIYQAYIFPELYYNKINLTTNIICDTNLLKKNIFKVKVSTQSNNVYFYDYYDVNNKQKLKTETILLNGIVEDTLLVVEYSNYQQISRSSELIMPFKIKQKIKNFEFTMQIDTIDDKSRIKKKLFDFEVKQ
ncbi:MAG: insulinase family protein [Bacteroidales bacterium]|nr:insulinase family protein [Bacteroidales bacterium]